MSILCLTGGGLQHTSTKPASNHSLTLYMLQYVAASALILEPPSPPFRNHVCKGSTESPPTPLAHASVGMVSASLARRWPLWMRGTNLLEPGTVAAYKVLHRNWRWGLRIGLTACSLERNIMAHMGSHCVQKMSISSGR